MSDPVGSCHDCGSPMIMLFQFYACAVGCHKLTPDQRLALRQRRVGVDESWGK